MYLTYWLGHVLQLMVSFYLLRVTDIALGVTAAAGFVRGASADALTREAFHDEQTRGKRCAAGTNCTRWAIIAAIAAIALADLSIAVMVFVLPNEKPVFATPRVCEWAVLFAACLGLFIAFPACGWPCRTTWRT